MRIRISNSYGFLIVAGLAALWFISDRWIARQKHPPLERLFPIDIADVVAIRIQQGRDTVQLLHEQGQWWLQDQGRLWRTNPGLSYSLERLLQHATQRLLQQQEARAMAKEKLDNRASVVAIILGNDTLRYHLAGDPSTKATYVRYASKAGAIVAMAELPGYEVYVGGVFFCTKVQWRHREIFSTQPRTLQRISLRYTKVTQDSLHIVATPQGMQVEGVPQNQLDTAALYAYLSGFESFYTNEYIAIGQVPRYDSLLEQAHAAELVVEDLTQEASARLNIYYDKTGDYVLLEDPHKGVSLCEKKRFDKFLVKKESFIIK